MHLVIRSPACMHSSTLLHGQRARGLAAAKEGKSNVALKTAVNLTPLTNQSG